MGGSGDLLTRILTGDLVAVLLAAGILTWPISWVLLAFYRRAVRRSMMTRASEAATSPRTAVIGVPASASRVATVDVSGIGPQTVHAEVLLRHLLARPWRAGRVYVLAGLAYAAALTPLQAWLAEPGAPFRPGRVLLLIAVFAWPVVPTLAIVAASARRQKFAIGCVYAAAYLGIVSVGAVLSPPFSVWQGILLWALDNAPGTALVAICLSRRIRAVAPLVLLFLILGFLGATALLVLFGSSDVLLRAAATVGTWVPSSGGGIVLGVGAAGFGAFAIAGWGLLAWIRRQYEAKRLSDEALTNRDHLVAVRLRPQHRTCVEHPLAPLGGVVAMGAFKLVTRVGFAGSSSAAGSGRKLLLLRSFSIGPRGERLFDALEKHWRRVGSIQMIAGHDLATRTVEPHEFLDFLTGTLTRRFIGGDDVLQRRLGEMDVLPDRDGRFRVNDFFCYADTWRAVLSSLVDTTDAVLMDLRGFSRRNAGCVFEIGELCRLVPLERVVFVVDDGTDAPFLQQTFDGAAPMAAGTAAPGGTPHLQPRLFRCGALEPRTIRALLRALAAAARPALEGA